MPARPLYRFRPLPVRVLDVMADGMWYSRPVLRQRTGLSSNSVGPAIQRNFRKGLIDKRLNPHHNHANPNGTLCCVGVPAARYVYRINDEGRQALEREKERRQHLGFAGFD